MPALNNWEVFNHIRLVVAALTAPYRDLFSSFGVARQRHGSLLFSLKVETAEAIQTTAFVQPRGMFNRPVPNVSIYPPSHRLTDSSSPGYSIATDRLGQLQNRHKGILRHINGADRLQPLFTFGLFLQQLFLTGNVAAVALR